MIRRPPRSTLFPHTPLSRPHGLRRIPPLHRPQPPPIHRQLEHVEPVVVPDDVMELLRLHARARVDAGVDRKSTRLNSSHGYISYAVFCLKKKKTEQTELIQS